MNDEPYFVVPSVEEFNDWNPRATVFRIWSNKCNKSIRVYCNNGLIYVKFPNSEWRRIVSSVSYENKTFKTKVELILPITKDNEENNL